MAEVAKTVDAKGQKCPMPVLMTAKAAKEMQAGEVMLIEATDGGARSDIPAWVSQTGNELLESSQDGEVLRFLVRKKYTREIWLRNRPADLHRLPCLHRRLQNRACDSGWSVSNLGEVRRKGSIPGHHPRNGRHAVQSLHRRTLREGVPNPGPVHSR